MHFGISSTLGQSTPTPESTCYRFDEFLVDAAASSLQCNGNPVILATRPMQLLLALLERRDRIVGKEELLRLVWPDVTVTDNTIAVAVFALRRALRDRPYVRTVYGRGYRLTATVTVSHGPAAPTNGCSPDRPSIAVLPFTEMGEGAHTHGCFGHGIAEDILSVLSHNRWLTVIARNSSFSFAEEAASVSKISKLLGVRYVLTGTVRRSGSTVRVTTHLSDATNDTHLLSERYDRPLGDLFDAQDDMTERIVAAIRPVLHEAEEDRALRRHPGNIDAWTAYQRGLWHLAQWRDDDVRESMVMFGRAIAIDPRYAPGYHGTARMFLHVGSGHRPIVPQNWQQEGERFALRAVELDGRDSEAHGAVAFARHLRGDHAGALLAAEQALRLNNNDAMAHATRGAALIFGGRANEGIDAIQSCLRLSPRDPRLKIRHMHIGLALFFRSDFPAARQHAATMVNAWPDYGPGYRLMAMALGEMGQLDQAQPFLERAVALEPSWFDNHSQQRKMWYRPADLAAVTRALVRAGWNAPSC